MNAFLIHFLADLTFFPINDSLYYSRVPLLGPSALYFTTQTFSFSAKIFGNIAGQSLTWKIPVQRGQ